MDAELVQIDIELAENEFADALNECVKAESRQLVDPFHVIGVQDDYVDGSAVRKLYRKWLVMNHPDKADTIQGECLRKFVISEYNNVLMSPDNDEAKPVMAVLKATFRALKDWDLISDLKEDQLNNTAELIRNAITDVNVIKDAKDEGILNLSKEEYTARFPANTYISGVGEVKNPSFDTLQAFVAPCQHRHCACVHQIALTESMFVDGEPHLGDAYIFQCDINKNNKWFVNLKTTTTNSMKLTSDVTKHLERIAKVFQHKLYLEQARSNLQKALCYKHDQGSGIPFQACWACAVNASLEESKASEDIAAEIRSIDFLLNNEGKTRVAVSADGWCLLNSWHISMKVIGHGIETYPDVSTLAEAAVQELRSNPVDYHLIGHFEEELAQFLEAKAFNKNSIDSMGFALAELTNLHAKIFAVDKFDPNKFITYEYVPRTDRNGSSKKIELALMFRTLHYDAVINMDDREIWRKKSVKELKSLATAQQIDISTCIEKQDLVDVLHSNAIKLMTIGFKPVIADTNSKFEIVDLTLNSDSDEICQDSNDQEPSCSYVKTEIEIPENIINLDSSSSSDNESKEGYDSDTDDTSNTSASDDTELPFSDIPQGVKAGRKKRKHASKKQKRRYHSEEFLGSLKPKIVEHLPHDIDGYEAFQLEYSSKSNSYSSGKHAVPVDGRPWGLSDVGLCSQADTCDQCMVQHPSCAWCKYPEFDKTENFARCNTRENLLQDGCIEEMIHSPKSSKNINRQEPLNANSEMGKIVQVTPQRITLKMRPGEPIRIPLTIRQSEDFPVDLYIVMDVTYTMKNDLDNLKVLGAVIVERMGAITKDFRLGFGAFVEKLTLPYVELIPQRLYEDPCAEVDLTCVPPFGFKNMVPLTSNTTRFSEEMKKVEPSANLDDMEGGMDALMQATVCTNQIGWRKHARHLLLYATDDSFHTAGDGLLGGIVTRNDGECHLDDMGKYTESLSMDYPSISQLSAAMKTHSVLPIFAIGPLTRRDKKRKTKPDPVIYYQDLPHFFHEAYVVRLTHDSDNIVDLVQEIYTNITSAVKIEDTAPTDIFDIDYTAFCGNGMKPHPGVSECFGIQLTDDVSFTIDITLNQSACHNGRISEQSYRFGVGPTSFNEELTVVVHPILECECSSNMLRADYLCNGTGDRVCGACVCDEGWSGVRCDCDREESEGIDLACVWKNTTSEVKECFGRGSCICGGCKCTQPVASDRQVYGTHCQCDNFSCPRYGNQVCGGTKRGSCLCNQTTGEHFCNCTDNYVGENCNCTRSLDECISPNGLVCSGVGECVCGKCQCHEEKYGGATCQNCRGCPGECELNKPCIQCKAFLSGDFYEEDPSCSQCPHPVLIVDELSRREGSKECRFQDIDDCSFMFTYERLKNGSYHLEVRRTKICPRPPDVLWAIIGIIVGITLVGLALLFIWRVLTNIHDRREFQQFEKERASARWQTGENPIYKPSTSVFKNPTYGK